MRCIAGKEDLQTVCVILLRYTEVWCPLAVHKHLIDFDLTVQSAVDYFAGVDFGTRRQLVHWVMRSKGILAVLVNDKAGMHGKGMPTAAESELLCEFLGAEVDEIDPNWPIN